jgi:hypothetical protein
MREITKKWETGKSKTKRNKLFEVKDKPWKTDMKIKKLNAWRGLMECVKIKVQKIYSIEQRPTGTEWFKQVRVYIKKTF